MPPSQNLDKLRKGTEKCLVEGIQLAQLPPGAWFHGHPPEVPKTTGPIVFSSCPAAVHWLSASPPQAHIRPAKAVSSHLENTKDQHSGLHGGISDKHEPCKGILACLRVSSKLLKYLPISYPVNTSMYHVVRLILLLLC